MELSLQEPDKWMDRLSRPQLALSGAAWPWLQVHDKRAAMAAALEEPDSLADEDAQSTMSTAVTGLSAYTQRTHGPSAGSTSAAGASTVGGRLPQGRKHKVQPSAAEVAPPLPCEGCQIIYAGSRGGVCQHQSQAGRVHADSRTQQLQGRVQHSCLSRA